MKKKWISLIFLLRLTGCQKTGESLSPSLSEGKESSEGTSQAEEGYTLNNETFEEETLSFEGDFDSQEKETFAEGTVLSIGSWGQDYAITEGGTFILTGENSDLQVQVNTSEEVTLILNSCTWTSKHGPALSVKNAGSFTLYAAKGTKNYLSDDENNTDEAALLVKKVPLALKGEGFLYVSGKGLSNDEIDSGVAIQSAKGITIESVHLTIKESDSHAINAKAGITIHNAKLNLTSEKDGLHSKEGGLERTDSTLISDTKGDGVDVLLDIEMENVTSNIVTKGSYTLYDASLDTDGSLYEDSKYILENGEYKKIAGDERNRYKTRYYLTQKCKGFKTEGTLSISQGDYYFRTDDDCLSGDTAITILDGDFVFYTKDQAINSDGKVSIGEETGTLNPDFRIKIFHSYEGIQGQEITFYDGRTYIVSDDDGINAATDDTTRTPSLSFYNPCLVYVQAEGDGIDSNGNITRDGGNVFVFGPSKGGNGGLDFDGTFTHTGGTVLALAEKGRNQVPDTSQVNAALFTVGSRSEGDSLSLFVSDREYSVILPKSYSSLQVVFSGPILKTGDTLIAKKGIVKQGTYQNYVYYGPIEGSQGEEILTLEIISGLSGEQSQGGPDGNRPGSGGPGRP